MQARLGSVVVGWLAVIGLVVDGLWTGALVRLALADPVRPNVVVILADDLGFSDLGAYGGEIDTPHLDRLARGGLRFTQATNTARCWPSRAALLTGFYPQAISRDALPEGDGREGCPGGAQGTRPPWARLLPELLKAAGYRSYHSGKWHVDGAPLAQGFDRSLDVTGTGQSNFFDPSGVTVEGKPHPQGDDFYATTAIGDHAVACLRSHAVDHPEKHFFHFVAFTAPHFPLQAPQAGIAKYRERYRAGWEAIRAARHARQLASGIVAGPMSAIERDLGPPYPFPEALQALGAGEVDRPLEWDRLSPKQQDFQATKMAIHAAMVEAMDEQIGRIVDQLEAMQRLDDTLILFASDNGASAEIMVRGEGHDPAAPPGSRKSFLCLGPGWSSAANTPFRRHKTWVHEGGIATPWIVHWPRGLPEGSAGELCHQPVHLIDVAPTVMELTVAKQPPFLLDGTLVPPMQGRSFSRLLADASAPSLRETSWWCHEGHRAVRVGDKKLIAAKGEPWALHDLAADRAETFDLAAAEPDTVARLEQEWLRIADDCRSLAAGALVAPAAAAPPRRPPGPNARHGIAAAETTLAEALRSRGYRTGMVGKWHLGHRAPFLPTRHGFDEWFGLPYSNDMWPHHPEAAPGSICAAPAMTIDLFPTVLCLTGEPLPVDADGRCTVDGRRIDGHDISGLLRGEPAASAVAAERPYGFWYLDNELQAVRRGRYKLLLPHTARTLAGVAPGAASGADGVPAKYLPLPVTRVLFDLEADPGETIDVAAEHPDDVAGLEAAALRLRGELGDRLTGVTGSEVRPAGKLEEAPPAASRRRPPNIIVVMTDDQGYGDLAAHGNPVLETPHLDKMWRESVRFTEYHVSPTCSPTRTALLTGRHEFRSGVTHTIHERERLALSATTLPQLLRAAGYTTGIFGKWHLGDEEAYQPGKRGFDRSVIHGAGGIAQHFPGSCGDVPGNRYVDPVLREDGQFVKRRGYCTDLFFAAGIEWIEAMARTDKPFFCLITPHAPHDPLDCPEGSDAGPRTRLAAAGLLDDAGRDRVAKFYGMIENIDTNVGRLLDRLESAGLAEDTLLIFTTDNGTATGAGVFNDFVRGAKGSVWRGGTRVPSLWRWPGTLPVGIDVPALVAHVDLLPTLCEIARAPIPAEVAVRLEGRSLVPLLLDARAPWPDRPLVTHLGRWERGKVAGAKWRHCRIREGRWSLVNVDNRADAWQLFDVLADPAERHDVAAAHGAIVARLAAEYDRWWDSIQEDLVNEDLDGPAENPFKTAFEAQVGVGVTAAMVDVP